MFFAFAVTLGYITIASCKYVKGEDGTTAIVYFLNRFGITNAVVNKPFLDDDANTVIPVLKERAISVCIKIYTQFFESMKQQRCSLNHLKSYTTVNLIKAELIKGR